MARQPATKQRGIFEKTPGSGVWWIQYFVDGQRRREKVGGKQAAINRYQQRKTEAREGRLPTPQRDISFDRFVTEYLEGERLRLRAFAEYQRHGRVWISGSTASAIVRCGASCRSTFKRGRLGDGRRSSRPR